MKLISMTQKLLELYKNFDDVNYRKDLVEYVNKSNNHANFRTKQLQLGDFVPTDKDGNVLEEPDNYSNTIIFIEGERRIYQQSLDNVIFEGFEVYYRDSETIILSDKKDNLIEFKSNGDIYVLDEYLVNTIEQALFFFERDEQELTITPQAIKRFNL